ncbi:hypothetical protein TRICI_004968 [Trichomonascus ciferrii]|uniref:OCIA domain-containing protein n=1 Tax=Trichomonascus ciferrii TaxID=44093 RepID=A0A642UXU6_9ASCO|nr:hypothetical protein TRICI_004968 [Trichomonascus ciferrii]
MSSPNAPQPYEVARRFHEVDGPLSHEQRTQLSAAFQSQQWAIPTGALSLLAAGIVGPRYAAKYKYIARPVTQTRLLSAFFGLFGFVVGGRIGYVAMYRHNRGKFDEGSGPQRAFELLANYPPQIGYAYYRTTARDPAYVMADPATIDWKREPPFPMNLVRSSMMAGRGAGPSPRSPDPRHPQQQQQPGQNQQQQSYEPSFYEVREDAAGGRENVQADSAETYASSWDRIRAQNSQNQGNNSSAQNGAYSPNGSYTQSTLGSNSSIGLATDSPQQSAGSFSQGSQPNSGSLTPIPPPPALSGPPRLQADTDAAYEDQKRFDEELERERMGYGVKDDFSDSERKWQNK